jgi:hypothetical protein
MAIGRSVLPGRLEDSVTIAQHAAAEALLRAGHGVVVDDTNLRLRHARAWAEVAARAGARFGVRDFTDVPLESCLARDAARAASGERPVGEAVSGFCTSASSRTAPSAGAAAGCLRPPSTADARDLRARSIAASRRGSSTSTAPWR